MSYPGKTSLKKFIIHKILDFSYLKINLTEAISYSPFFKVPSAFTFFTSLFGMVRGALYVAIITNLQYKIKTNFSN